MCAYLLTARFCCQMMNFSSDIHKHPCRGLSDPYVQILPVNQNLYHLWSNSHPKNHPNRHLVKCNFCLEFGHSRRTTSFFVHCSQRCLRQRPGSQQQVLVTVAGSPLLLSNVYKEVLSSHWTDASSLLYAKYLRCCLCKLRSSAKEQSTSIAGAVA